MIQYALQENKNPNTLWNSYFTLKEEYALLTDP